MTSLDLLLVQNFANWSRFDKIMTTCWKVCFVKHDVET